MPAPTPTPTPKPPEARETVELTAFVVALVNGLGLALEDGDLDLTDVPDLFAALRTAPAAFQGISEVPHELGPDGLSSASRAAIEAELAKLDLPSKPTEAMVRKIAMTGILVMDLVLDFVQLRGAAKAATA